MIYVIDASSFIELEDSAYGAGYNFDVVLARLTDLCTANRLTFPPLVVRDCRDFGSTDIITSWVRTCANGLRDNSPGYDLAGEVLGRCPTVLDPDDERESAELEVLALAMSRVRAGDEVTVVTAQWIDFPTRQSLGNAALDLAFSAVNTADFVREVMR